MLYALQNADLNGYTGQDYSIAVNPTVNPAGSGNAQNFIIPYTSSSSNDEPTPTPEPSTMLLSLAGLAGLAAYRKFGTKRPRPESS
ncbi:MAG: PEP-CTERM sorting domain-containing protein [Desulforhabdus sp.]|jgi:hypothetical protein|nr:PEP-CTERM sorting domain-containing protein [Desulforhabdus sp.]